jgi:hypothetical protein
MGILNRHLSLNIYKRCECCETSRQCVVRLEPNEICTSETEENYEFRDVCIVAIENQVPRLVVRVWRDATQVASKICTSNFEHYDISSIDVNNRVDDDSEYFNLSIPSKCPTCWIIRVGESLDIARIAAFRSGRLKYGTGLCALCPKSTAGDGTNLAQLLCVSHVVHTRDAAESGLVEIDDYLKPCHDLEKKREMEWQRRLEYLKSTTQMPFGKYKSMYVTDICKRDMKYVVWIAGWKFNYFRDSHTPIEHDGLRCPETHREYARIILSNICLYCFGGFKSTRSRQALCDTCVGNEHSFKQCDY